MIGYTGSSTAISYPSQSKTSESLSTEEMFKKVPQKSNKGDVAVLKNKSEDNNQLLHAKSDETPVLLSKKGESTIAYLRPKSVEQNEKAQMPAIKYGSYEKQQEDALQITGKVSSIMTSFDALAAEIGAVNNKISKEQLDSYLKSLQSEESGTDVTQAIAFVKNLIARFDSLSGGADYITSYVGIKEPQDYKTVTQEQVTFPIDIRV